MSNDDLDFGQTIRGFVAGQQMFGRYTLRQMLGRGGMGVVWLARDERLGEDIALKFVSEMVRLDPIALEELKRETRRSRQLTHQRIVRIHDFAQDSECAAISMEYVDGWTLAALRAAQPHLFFEVDEIAGWTSQLCEGLSYAHDRAKIVHRDIKPVNVMILRNGNVKITDFGIAGSISESVSRISLVSKSSGTLAYMSPQQMMGDPPSATDDIYALGASLYELLTGKPPFFRGDIQAQLQSRVAPAMSARRQELLLEGAKPIPAEWENVVAACLEKDPSNRPQSIAAVAGVLFSQSTALSHSTADSPVKCDSGGSKIPLPVILVCVAAAALLTLFLAAGAGWYYWGAHRPGGEVATPTAADEMARKKAEQIKAEQIKAGLAAARTAADIKQWDAAEAQVVNVLQLETDNSDALQIRKAANNAHAEDLYNEANALFESNAGAVSDTESVRLYQQAADMGLAKACGGLARAYITGRGATKDYAKARQLLSPAIAVDDPLAENCMGKLYEEGLGVERNPEEAVKWYRKAATEGFVRAERNLGRMFHDGSGIPKDDIAAALWFRKAAEQGDKDSQYYTGWAFLNGLGVRKNLEEARAWLLKPADHGDADAQYSLGVLALDPDNPHRDKAEAIRWFKLAAAQSHQEAQENLRRIEADQTDKTATLQP